MVILYKAVLILLGILLLLTGCQQAIVPSAYNLTVKPEVAWFDAAEWDGTGIGLYVYYSANDPPYSLVDVEIIKPEKGSQYVFTDLTDGIYYVYCDAPSPQGGLWVYEPITIDNSDAILILNEANSQN